MTEENTIKFIKNVLLNVTEPRGKEAEENLRWGLQEYFKKQLAIQGVGCSLPSKDEKLIGNMCLSFRHDFGLLPKLIQEDLKRDCKNWLISYENNRK